MNKLDTTSTKPAEARKRRRLTLGQWFPSIILLLTLLYAWNPLDSDSGLFAHAAVGRWIVSHHAVPRHTLFLWSFGRDWVAHSWLSEVLTYAALAGHERAGVALCTAISVGLYTLTFLLAWRARDREIAAGVLLPALFAVAIMGGLVRYQPRPEAFTDVFTAVTLLVLIRLRQSSMRPLMLYAAMFAMFALWTNLHGAVISGIVLIALKLGGDTLQYKFDALSRKTTLVLAACLAAMLVNPYGLHYFSIYAQVNSSVFKQIEEWFPPFQAPMLDIPSLGAAFGVLAAALVLLVRDKDRSIAELGWLAYGLVSFLMARRNILELIVIALIVAARRASVLTSVEERIEAALARGSALAKQVPTICLALVIVAVAAHAPFVTRPDPLNLLPPHALPVGQARFVVEHNIGGDVFNDYNTASYLEWRLYGGCRFFVDSMNAYGDEILAPEAHVLLGDPVGMRYLDDHGIDCVIGRNKDPIEPNFPPLYYRLTNDPHWALVYFESDGPIWIRRTPTTQAIWSHPVPIR